MLPITGGSRGVRRPISAVILFVASQSALAASGPCSLGVVAELPVTIVDSHALISGTINGQGAVFMADSGAFYSMLSKGAADRFGLRLGPLPYGLGVVGLGGDEQALLATATDFDLAGLHGGPLHKVEFIVGGNAFAGTTSGLIGQNVLALFDTEYDLANGVIRMVKAKDCWGHDLAYWRGPKDVAVIDVARTTPREPHIIGSALLNGKRIRVEFDSGAASSLLTKRAAERVGVKVTDPGVVANGVGSGVGPRAFETWAAPFKLLDLGGEQIQNIKLRVADVDYRTDVDLFLGRDFFLSHRIYFANSQHKVYFTYNGGPVFSLSEHRAAQETPADSAATAGTAGDVPADAAGFLRRGEAFAGRRDYPHAIADFDRAAEMDGANADVYYQRALARWWMHQPVLAMADLDEALRLQPGMVRAFITRAELRLSNNDDKGAGADFEAAQRAESSDGYIVVRIGSSYAHYGRFDEAIRHYDRWLEANPKDDRRASVLNSRCWARASWGKELDLALKDCDEALKRGQRSSQMFDSRGLVKLRLGDTDGAIKDYRESLSLQANNAFSLYGLGLAQSRKGAAADADASFKAALAIRPTIADEFKKIGLVREP